jgi:spermidine synthase
MFPQMAQIVKPARVGIAEVTHYTVTKLDVLREMMHGGPAEEGTVAILRVAGRTMMSDTKHERLTNWEFWHKAEGDVLIAGLGIGMVVHGILSKELKSWEKRKPITSVTVLEKEADVIALISPTLPSDPRLKIIHADVFDWKPTQQYDCLYFDIWADGSSDLAKSERRRLGQKYRRFKADGAWLGYWRPMEAR